MTGAPSHDAAFWADDGLETQAPHGPAPWTHWLTKAGALLSLALLLGGAYWAYDLMRRDLAGVPVIHADASPMRRAPENPGGEEADHQGLAVNSVTAFGGAAPVAEALVLAPRPVDLAPEDGPGLGAAPTEVAGTITPPEDALRPAAAAAPAAAPPASGTLLIEAALTQALSDDPSALATPVLEADPALASLRPRARPLALGAAPSTETEAAAPAPAAENLELAAASLPSGAWLVQLGAFDDEASARREWDALESRFAAPFTGKSRVLEPAEIAGRAFVRLRVSGFAAKGAALEFCAPLLAESRTCIPVAHP